jgi:hypothetical protein
MMKDVSADASTRGAEVVDMTLEVVVVPVGDVDRAAFLAG